VKPKLLITLGCSWTVGIGAYQPEINYNVNKPLNQKEKDDIFDKYFNKNLDNFHQKSWPKLVGKKLGFDKVINLGYEGAANSYSVKKIFEYFEDNNNKLKNYDVLIIWLMSDPIRISFYTDKKLKNYVPTVKNPRGLISEYINEIDDIVIDPLLEQKFYMKVLENFCDIHNFYLITTSWSQTFEELFNIYHSKKIFLHTYPKRMAPPYDTNGNGDLLNYSYCDHPNERGYEWIANKIVEGIKQNHDKWYSEIENEKLQYEFKGDPHIFKPNVI
jgi:hypothetical protein